MREPRTLLTIGLPVYNGGMFLREALESLRKQSFRDYKVVISDNASVDNTEDIARDVEIQDPRFRYIRHEANMGAAANFMSVASAIDTPYFTWFAADDVAAPTFLETCLAQLARYPRCGMAFTGLRNIDGRGRPIRDYAELPRLAGSTHFRTVARFLSSPEIMGKANLIYSVYRTPVLRAAIARLGLREVWGADIAFVLAAIIEGGGISIAPEVLFFKRWVRSNEQPDSVTPTVPPTSPLDRSYPLEYFAEYEQSLLDAARGSDFYRLVAFIMEFRHRHLQRYKRYQDDWPGLQQNRRLAARTTSRIRCDFDIARNWWTLQMGLVVDVREAFRASVLLRQE